jgi:hypothetical protein
MIYKPKLGCYYGQQQSKKQKTKPKTTKKNKSIIS